MQSQVDHNQTRAGAGKRLRAFLVTWQGLLLVGLWVAVIGFAWIAGSSWFSVCAGILRSSREDFTKIRVLGEAEADGPPAEPAFAAAPKLKNEEKKDAGAGGAKSPADEIPDMEWDEEEMIRRAAALLVRHNEYEEAIRVLNRGEGGDEAALAIGRALYKKAVDSAHDAVRVELERVKQVWDGFAEENRQACFGTDEEGKRNAFEKILAGVAEELRLEYLGRFVPESLLFCLAGNVRHELSRQKSCPDELAELIMEPLFQPTSLSRRLHRGSDVEGRLSYEESREILDRQLNKQVLMPVVKTFLSGVQRRLKEATPEVDGWFNRTLGLGFCRELARCQVGSAGELDLRLLWRRLPERIRALWSRHFHHVMMERESFALPGYVLAENFWLRYAGGKLDSDTVRIVRQHPAWGRQMRRFAYQAALGGLPKILHELGAESDAVAFEDALKRPLLVERRQLVSKEFDWEALRENLNVVSGFPPALKIRGGSTRRKRGRKRGLKWDAVSMEDFHEGLLELAESGAAPEKQVWYRRLARLYALNRGMD